MPVRWHMPSVAAILRHPLVQQNAALVSVIETCADKDKFDRLSHDELRLYLGIQLGFIKMLLDRDDAVEAALV